MLLLKADVCMWGSSCEGLDADGNDDLGLCRKADNHLFFCSANLDPWAALWARLVPNML